MLPARRRSHWRLPRRRADREIRMKLFFGSVSWAPTWIESCVTDAGWARVTGGKVIVIVARCASCDHAARDQVPMVTWRTTPVPAAITVATFDE